MVKVPPRRGVCASAEEGAAIATVAPPTQSYRRSRRARAGRLGMASGYSPSDPCASPSSLILPEGCRAGQRREIRTILSMRATDFSFAAVVVYSPPVSAAWRALLFAVWLAGPSL